MDAALAIQYVVIALAVLASAWVVMRKQFPAATRRLRIAIAVPMVREQRPAWLRRLALRIAPAGQAVDASACGGCDNCGPSSH
jgi:hypothetical protein